MKALEHMNLYVVAAGFFLLFIANLAVTWKCIRSPEFDGSQKALQCILVWVVPAVGVMVIYTLLRTLREPSGPNYRSFGGGAPSAVPPTDHERL